MLQGGQLASHPGDNCGGENVGNGSENDDPESVRWCCHNEEENVKNAWKNGVESVWCDRDDDVHAPNGEAIAMVGVMANPELAVTKCQL
jgi:hypothetical protein